MGSLRTNYRRSLRKKKCGISQDGTIKIIKACGKVRALVFSCGKWYPIAEVSYGNSPDNPTKEATKEELTHNHL